MPIERAKALYARTLHDVVYVRRFTGTGPARPYFDTQARARVMGYGPEQLVGAIAQGDRKVILYAQDLIDAGFSLPVVTGDKLVVRGKELTIMAADDSTRRDDGELIALEIQCRG